MIDNGCARVAVKRSLTPVRFRYRGYFLESIRMNRGDFTLILPGNYVRSTYSV